MPHIRRVLHETAKSSCFILTRLSDSGVAVSQLQRSVASMRTNFVKSNMVTNQNLRCAAVSARARGEEKGWCSIKTVTAHVQKLSNITRTNEKKNPDLAFIVERDMWVGHSRNT